MPRKSWQEGCNVSTHRPSRSKSWHTKPILRQSKNWNAVWEIGLWAMNDNWAATPNRNDAISDFLANFINLICVALLEVSRCSFNHFNTWCFEASPLCDPVHSVIKICALAFWPTLCTRCQEDSLLRTLLVFVRFCLAVAATFPWMTVNNCVNSATSIVSLLSASTKLNALEIDSVHNLYNAGWSSLFRANNTFKVLFNRRCAST